MRISLALLFAVVLQLSAEDGYAQRTRVAISMNNVSVEQVLNKIEETSDYVFLYNDKTIQKNGLSNNFMRNITPHFVCMQKGLLMIKKHVKISFQMYLLHYGISLKLNPLTCNRTRHWDTSRCV